MRKSFEPQNLFQPVIVVMLLILSSSAWCLEPYRIDSYHYNAAGKIDPFRPLVKAEVPKKNTSLVKLTPLQRFDINQLKLVGIAGTGAKKIAMVLDPRGRSYVVSPGTLIGQNNGRVMHVLEDQIVVEEKKSDDSKKSKVNRLTLKLYHYEENP